MGPKELCADIIGVRWVAHGRDKKGIDCAGVAALVLARLGFKVPSSAWTWSGSDQWIHVGEDAGDASELGDVIVSKTEDGVLHVSVLVDKATRACATASRELGCVLTRYWAIQGVVGVYRWPT